MSVPKSIALLDKLQETWPRALRLPLAPDAAAIPVTHPLAGELRAALQGRETSLPQFAPGQGVRWYTFVREASDLRPAVEALQAWVIPSFGWEETADAYWVDRPDEPLADMARTAGYRAVYRWRSHDGAGFDRVAQKLGQSRWLDTQAPAGGAARTPSLVELRRQYAEALALGDPSAAGRAIAAIRDHQLDSPANITFLKYRLWDRLLEHHRITQDQDLDRWLRQEMPRRVRVAIARAFHAVFLADAEGREDLEAALEAFNLAVRNRLEGLLSLLRLDDGPEVARLLAYQSRGGGRADVEGLAKSQDAWIARVLMPLPQTTAAVVAPSPVAPSPAAAEELSDEEQFFAAAARRDWRLLQEKGLVLLKAAPELVRPLLLRSLTLHPNAAVQEALARVEPTPPLVQSWSQWVAAALRGDAENADVFVTADRPSPSDAPPAEIERLIAALEDLFTDQAAVTARGGRCVLQGLAELVGDFAHEPRFPRREWADLYLALFRVWGTLVAGSADLLDGNVLLTLGDAALTYRDNSELEVAEGIKRWWEGRRVRSQVPFVLDAIGMLMERSSAQGVVEGLWLDAGELFRRDPNAVAPSDHALWRSVGRRVGFDDATIDAYLPPPAQSTSAAGDGDSDPIAAADLKRIAIVWRRQDLANNAARRIRERTKADVFVVFEEHPRAQTQHAMGADVILFVWGNVSHAVFHEIEKVPRARFAYVPVPTPGNVERTLERWVMAQREPTAVP